MTHVLVSCLVLIGLRGSAAARTLRAVLWLGTVLVLSQAEGLGRLPEAPAFLTHLLPGWSGGISGSADGPEGSKLWPPVAESAIVLGKNKEIAFPFARPTN